MFSRFIAIWEYTLTFCMPQFYFFSINVDLIKTKQQLRFTIFQMYKATACVLLLGVDYIKFYEPMMLIL